MYYFSQKIWFPQIIRDFKISYLIVVLNIFAINLYMQGDHELSIYTQLCTG